MIRLIQNVYGNGSDEEGNGINMSRSKSSGNSKLGGLAGLCEVLEKEEGGQKWKAQNLVTDVPHESERVNVYCQEVTRLKEKRSNKE